MASDEELQSPETLPHPEILPDDRQRLSRKLRRYLAAMPWTVIVATVSAVLLLIFIAFAFSPTYWRF
jgi:hypothetical protein